MQQNLNEQNLILLGLVEQQSAEANSRAFAGTLMSFINSLKQESTALTLSARW